MALNRLRSEIGRLDQEICATLSKKPPSTDDNAILEFKKQRLAEARKEVEMVEEREYHRKQRCT
jgi:hypothetical protein